MNRDELIHQLRNPWGHDARQAMLNAADMLEADLLFRQEIVRSKFDDVRVIMHEHEQIVPIQQDLFQAEGFV